MSRSRWPGGEGPPCAWSTSTSRTPADPIYVEGLPVIDDHLRPLRRRHELAYLERARDRLAAGVSASVVFSMGRPRRRSPTTPAPWARRSS